MISGSDGSVIFFAGHDRWCQSNHLWGFEHLLVAAFALGLFRDRRTYWMTGVTMRRDSGKFLKMQVADAKVKLHWPNHGTEGTLMQDAYIH